MRWLTPTLLVLLILCAPADLSAAQAADAVTQQPQSPDVLYSNREHLPSAVAAAAAWEARLEKDPRDFEAAWKLARACYWLGGRVPPTDRRAQYERGVARGQRASELEPGRPEGHFWTAANMGALAESFGIRAGLKYRGTIKRELETVLAIDPAFEYGSADRALGRWYFRVPGLFGGSKSKSVEHLLESLQYDPASAASHFFLAETYLDMDREEDARRHLQRVLEAPIDGEWGPETKDFKVKATALMEKLRR